MENNKKTTTQGSTKARTATTKAKETAKTKSSATTKSVAKTTATKKAVTKTVTKPKTSATNTATKAPAKTTVKTVAKKAETPKVTAKKASTATEKKLPATKPTPIASAIEPKTAIKQAPKTAPATKVTKTKSTAKTATTTAKNTENKVVAGAKPQAKQASVNTANNKLKVLYVVSECHPFCATGGLADVAGGLPKFINKNSNIDMRVVLPMYSDIPSIYRDNFKFLGHKYVPVAWRNVYCGVFTYTLNDVTYYFLDNEYYFKRGGGIYSYYDDGERFAFTSRAVLELISFMNFTPDIIHCNDWQSALIPIYLKTIYAGNEAYNKIKTVFTLHNTEYQGKFNVDTISDLFGIDARYTSAIEYNKDLNLVKGAIVYCDKFTTVSPTYAKEILSPEHSNGLDPILRSNSYKISGILNAIDCDYYNPKTDKVLYKNYDINSIADKVINKTSMQKEMGLEVNPNIPMMCIVTRMAKHKGLDLIKNCMEEILCSNNVQFVAVGGGDREYEDYFRYLQNKYPTKVKALLGYSNIMGRKAYGASDIFLMPSKSEPCGISQMIASRYGAIPIVRETGGLKDSMWDFGCAGGGNAYTFGGYNTNELVYSIKRALNDYNNKAEWLKKMQTCMSRDFSWKVSAEGYISLYNELVK